MRFLPLLLASCAGWSVHTGEPHPQDTLCGRVDSVTAKIRPGVGSAVTCEEEIEALEEQGRATKLAGQWTLYVTSGWVGIDVDNRDGMPVFMEAGTFYPQHAMEIKVSAFPRRLEHELQHAHDLEDGIANTRDAW